MRRMVHEEFIKRLYEKNHNIIAISKYTRSTDKMIFHCKVCGHEWETYPHNLLRGRGCASCSRHLKYTTESFINRMNEINCNIEVIGEYINNHTPIKCRCLIDNTI